MTADIGASTGAEVEPGANAGDLHGSLADISDDTEIGSPQDRDVDQYTTNPALSAGAVDLQDRTNGFEPDPDGPARWRVALSAEDEEHNPSF